MTRAIVLLAACFTVAPMLAAQDPPRDVPPAYVTAARLEAELKAQIAAEGLTVVRALALARYQEQRGAVADAEQTLVDARRLFPSDEPLIAALVQLNLRQRKGSANVALLDELAALRPADPRVHYTVATFYEEMLRKGESLTPADKQLYAKQGIAALDRALALNPTYGDALAYKNILLRHQAVLETDPARQRILLSEADGLRAQAIELLKQRPPGTAPSNTGAPPPPPPPPPRTPCRPAAEILGGQLPVRVGGNIQAPTKVRDVRPVYPVEAQTARIMGVVIIEATIDTDGRIAQACVLRSIPLLDAAAIDAVNQWVFTPTLLNGVPVPVVMTVTVNFTLEGGN